jgi:hypothetical protein
MSPGTYGELSDALHRVGTAGRILGREALVYPVVGIQNDIRAGSV